MSQLSLRELEETVVDAWPAVETSELDGWLLRSSGGPSHRGNSAATLDAGDGMALPMRIERVEAWYQARERLPMFQVGPCAMPTGLDEALAERGYRVEGEAKFASASAVDVLARLRRRPMMDAQVVAHAGPSWFDIGVTSGRFAASPEVFKGVLKQLGSRARFALAFDAKGTPCAAALGVASEDRLEVYAMFTLPHARKRGAGSGLLRALAQSAQSDGMRELYLLVETDNESARGLYAEAGFTDVYQYHYRVLDDGPRAMS